jgi:hypothetical protein
VFGSPEPGLLSAFGKEEPMHDIPLRRRVAGFFATLIALLLIVGLAKRPGELAAQPKETYGDYVDRICATDAASDKENQDQCVYAKILWKGMQMQQEEDRRLGR